MSTVNERTQDLRGFIEKESERVLSACTQCGKCFTACPMTKFADMDLSSANSTTVVGGLLSILKGEQGSPEALAWTGACVGSGECIPACPEGLNPLLMVRMARMVAGGGTGRPVQLKVPDDITHFPRMRAFVQLQLSSDEAATWL